MKKVIWKFRLEDVYEQTIRMPRRAAILGTVQLQHDYLVFWALVNPSEQLIDIEVLMPDTGDNIAEVIPSQWIFLGTVQLPNKLVRHVFIKNEV